MKKKASKEKELLSFILYAKLLVSYAFCVPYLLGLFLKSSIKDTTRDTKSIGHKKHRVLKSKGY